MDGSIQKVEGVGEQTVITIHQAGQMPSPVVLDVVFADREQNVRQIANGKLLDDGVQRLTWPVDVWFGGARTFEIRLDCRVEQIERLTLDPRGRFPDADKSDNTWPR